MPYIIIEKDEDYLKAYQRYMRTKWYKRIRPRQWFLIILGAFILGLGGNYLWGYISGWFTTGFSLWGF